MRCVTVVATALVYAAMSASAHAGSSELEHELYRELHRGQQSRIAPQPAVETLACYERLTKIAQFVHVSSHPEPSRCAVGELVRLDEVLLSDHGKVTLSPPATLTCATAERFARFIRDDLAPAAADFTAPPASLTGVGSFECRQRQGATSAKLSEHAKGNAIDIGTIRLRNGVQINLTDPRASRTFREKTRALACSRFTTVLGPGSDSFHNGHIHLDFLERSRGYRICQWDVTDQVAISIEIPLPRPKPLPAKENQQARPKLSPAKTKVN
jgi:hypothetical protein